ncbi:MAG TPA: DUF417 family protein [Stellaceae bacterium]|nr:DUF417 family protein [Stellaceae bacterium]
MRWLANTLARSGLLAGDIDYHLVRGSMVIIFLFFGYQKWFGYEAQVLVPYISNGPLIFWLYPVFGTQGASWFLGVSEWLFCVLLFLGFWNKRLGVCGAIGSCITFIATVTIIPFMPDGWATSAGGFPAMDGNVLFLMKDVVLLAASIYLLKQDLVRVSLDAKHGGKSDFLIQRLLKLAADLGLLRDDLDYNLLRASMVIIFAFFGYTKWHPYAAQELIPFISNGPLISWMYPAFGIRGATRFLGGSEWTILALLYAGFWDKRLGALGAAGSTAAFVCTATIIPFMPDGWAASAGGFPAMAGNVPFLMKDLVLLAVSIYLLKQDLLRVSQLSIGDGGRDWAGGRVRAHSDGPRALSGD